MKSNARTRNKDRTHTEVAEATKVPGNIFLSLPLRLLRNLRALCVLPPHSHPNP